jgi:hypothetical protein
MPDIRARVVTEAAPRANARLEEKSVAAAGGFEANRLYHTGRFRAGTERFERTLRRIASRVTMEASVTSFRLHARSLHTKNRKTMSSKERGVMLQG